MAMAEKKLSDEPDESLVFKKYKSSVTKTINMEIHDFSKEIENEETKKNPIESPIMTLGDIDLCIVVFPCHDDGNTLLRFWLLNQQQKNILISMSGKVASVGFELKKEKLDSNEKRSFIKILTHETYKMWAEKNEDVLKVEATLTFHYAEGTQEWTSRR